MARKRKPARLYQRNDDEAWIILDGGKQIRTGYGRGQHSEAENALKEYLIEKAYQDSSPKDSTRIVFGLILARYVNDKAAGMASPERLVYAIQALNPFWSDKKAHTMSGAVCREYAKQRKVSNETVRRELGVLQAAINHAHREGIRLPV